MNTNTNFDKFKRICQESRDGDNEEAKALEEVIGDMCDCLIKNLRAIGLKADNCDLIYELEAQIYHYVVRSNPK